MTSIEWTRGDDGTEGKAWNPVRGCTRVSEGCRNCYAERMAARFSGVDDSDLRGGTVARPYAFHGYAHMTPAGPRWTGRVELIPSKLDEPLHWKKPRRVFVNSMSDLFHEALTNGQINRVFSVMARAPQHTFQVLTKRPARMADYFAWARVANATVKVWPLPNVWLGVSVEDQATADERIPLLLQTPAAVRWVSYEPALGPVDFEAIRVPLAGESYMVRSALHATDGLNRCDGIDQSRLDWIVVGGESGPGARPFDVGWAYYTIAQCRLAVGELHLRDRKGGDMSEWEPGLRVREFPE
jgi:protein gp37